MYLNFTDSELLELRNGLLKKFSNLKATMGKKIPFADFNLVILRAIHSTNERSKLLPESFIFTWDEAEVIIYDSLHSQDKRPAYLNFLPEEANEAYFINLSYLLQHKEQVLNKLRQNSPLTDERLKNLLCYEFYEEETPKGSWDLDIILQEYQFKEPGKYDYRSVLPKPVNELYFQHLVKISTETQDHYNKSAIYLSPDVRWNLRESIDEKFRSTYKVEYPATMSYSAFNKAMLDAIHNPLSPQKSATFTWTEACMMISDILFHFDTGNYCYCHPKEADNTYFNNLWSTIQKMSDLYEKLKTWGNGKTLSIEDIRKHAKDSSLSEADRLTKEDINLLITDLGYPERVFEYKDFLPKEADEAFFKDLLQENDDEGKVVQPPAGQHIQVPNIIYDWDEEERRITAVATGKGKIKLGLDSYEVDGINIAFKSIRTIPGAKHILTAWYSDNENSKATKEVIIPANKGKYKEKTPVITPKYGSGSLTATASAANKCVLIMLSKTNTPSYVVAVGENAATATHTYSEKTLNKFDAKACVIEQGERCSDYVREHIEIPAVTHIPEDKKPEIHHDKKDGVLTVTATGNYGVHLKVSNKKNKKDFKEDEKDRSVSVNLSYDPNIKNVFHVSAYSTQKEKRVSDYVNEDIPIEPIESPVPSNPKPIIPDKPKITENHDNGTLHITATGDGIVRLEAGGLKDEKKGTAELTISYNPEVDNTFKAVASIMENGVPVNYDTLEIPIKANIIPDPPVITWTAENGTLIVTATGKGKVRLEIGKKINEREGTATLKINYKTEIDNNFTAQASIIQNQWPVNLTKKIIKIEAIKPDPPVITWTAKDGILTVVATSEGHVKLVIGKLSKSGNGTASLSITYKTTQDNTFKAKASLTMEGQIICTAEKDIKIDAVIPEPPIIKWTAKDGTLTVVATGEGLVKLKVGNQSQEGEGTATLNISYRTEKDSTYKARASIMVNKKAVCTSEQDIKIDAIIPEPPAIPDPPIITWKAENGTLVVTATGEGQVRLEIGKKSSQGKGTATLEISYETEKDNTFKAKAYIVENGMPVNIAEQDIKIDAIIPEPPAIPDPPVITWKAENGTLVVTATGEGQVRVEIGSKSNQGKGTATLEISYETEQDNTFKAKAFIIENQMPVNIAEQDIKIDAIIPEPPAIPEPPVITWKAENGTLVVTATGEGRVRLEVGKKNDEGDGNANLSIPYNPDIDNIFRAVACIMENGESVNYIQEDIYIPALPRQFTEAPEITWKASSGVLTVIATGDGLVRLEVDHLANQGEGRSYLYFYYSPTRNSTFNARACFMDGENRASDYTQKIINIPAEPPKPEIPGGSATGGGNAGGDDPGSGVGGGEGENKLESLDFKYLICGPLKACMEAQEEAAQATTDYLTTTMLLKDDDIADYKPVMMNFYFERDGIYHELSIPLMTILPVPYMSIEHVDLNFQAMVTYSEKDEGNDKYELKACYPSYTSETKRNTTTQSETTARQNIDIRLRATTTDQPAGVSRLIQILDQELSEIVPIAPKTDTKYPAIKEPVAESPTPNESNIEELVSLGPITTDDAHESTSIEVKPETDNDSKPMEGIAQLVIPPEKPEAGEALYSYSEVIPPEKPEAGEALYSYSEVIPPTDNATIPGRTVVMPPDDAIDQPKEDQSIVKRPPKRTNRVIKRRAKIDDKNKSDG